MYTITNDITLTSQNFSFFPHPTLFHLLGPAHQPGADGQVAGQPGGRVAHRDGGAPQEEAAQAHHAHHPAAHRQGHDQQRLPQALKFNDRWEKKAVLKIFFNVILPTPKPSPFICHTCAGSPARHGVCFHGHPPPPPTLPHPLRCLA